MNGATVCAPSLDRPQGEAWPHRPGESGRVYWAQLARPFPLGACWPLLPDPQSPHSSPVLLVVDGKVIPGFGAQKEPRSRQKPHPRNPAFTNCQCDHLAPSSLFRTKIIQSTPNPLAHVRVQYIQRVSTVTPGLTSQLSLAGCVTLGVFLNLSAPQFPPDG